MNNGLGWIASKKTDGQMSGTLIAASYSHSWSLPVQVFVLLNLCVNRQNPMDVRLAADKEQLHALSEQQILK